MFRLDFFCNIRSLTTARPGCASPPMVEGSHLGQFQNLIQEVRPQGWGHLRANLRFGYSGASLPPGCILSSANLLYGRIFLFGLSWIGIALVKAEQSALGWPLECVRAWKLSRMYPGEKPLPFSLPTQKCCFATHEPTLYLLAILNISVGTGAFY